VVSGLQSSSGNKKNRESEVVKSRGSERTRTQS
jgi:hypothetical protein